MTSIQKRHEFPKGELRIVAPDDAGRWISIENACISGIEGEPQNASWHLDQPITAASELPADLLFYLATARQDLSSCNFAPTTRNSTRARLSRLPSRTCLPLVELSHHLLLLSAIAPEGCSAGPSKLDTCALELWTAKQQRACDVVSGSSHPARRARQTNACPATPTISKGYVIWPWVRRMPAHAGAAVHLCSSFFVLRCYRSAHELCEQVVNLAGTSLLTLSDFLDLEGICTLDRYESGECCRG